MYSIFIEFNPSASQHRTVPVPKRYLSKIPLHLNVTLFTHRDAFFYPRYIEKYAVTSIVTLNFNGKYTVTTIVTVVVVTKC